MDGGPEERATKAEDEGVIQAGYEMCAACAIVVLMSYIPAPEAPPGDTTVPPAIRTLAKRLFWDKVSPDGRGLAADDLRAVCLGEEGRELMAWVYHNGGKKRGSIEAWIQRQLLGEFAPRAGLEVAEFQPQEVDKDGVFGLFVNHGRRRVTVTFRGSQILLDWEQNLETGMVTFQRGTTGALPTQQQQHKNGTTTKTTTSSGRIIDLGHVHSGFHDVVFGEPKTKTQGSTVLYEAIVDQLLKEFSHELLASTPDADPRRSQTKYALWVAGHSKGGAEATLFGVAAAVDDRLRSVFDGPVTILSFASPRVGDYAFRRAHEELESTGKLRHIRFMNADDIVPTIPFCSFTAGRGYTHCGARVVLREGRDDDLVLASGIEYIDADHSTGTDASTVLGSVTFKAHFTWIYLGRLDAAMYELQLPRCAHLGVSVKGAYDAFFPGTPAASSRALSRAVPSEDDAKPTTTSTAIRPYAPDAPDSITVFTQEHDNDHAPGCRCL